MKLPLFCYGTLQSPEVISSVIGKVPHGVSGILRDYGIYGVTGVDFPGIKKEPGSEVPGILYFELDDESMGTLDRFEGELYERTAVLIHTDTGETIEAFVYAIANDKLTVLTDKSWTLEEFLEDGFTNFMASYVNGRKGTDY